MDEEEGNEVLVVMNEFDLLEDGWCRVGVNCRATLIHPWWVDSVTLSTGVRQMAAAKAGFWHTILTHGTGSIGSDDIDNSATVIPIEPVPGC
jgi:hypothetical protein